MSDGQIPDLNLEELMEKIRAEVSRRKAGASAASTSLLDSSLDYRPVYNHTPGKWPQVENAINMAEQVSQVGTYLPGMHTFKGWKRKVALFAGKMYLRLSQVITRDQRSFNGSILAAVRSLQETTKQIESAVTKNSEYLGNINNLEHALHELENSSEEKLSRVYLHLENGQSKSEKNFHELRVRLNSDESNTNKQLSDISSHLSHINEEFSSRLNEVSTKMDENTSRFQGETEKLSLELKKALQKIDYLKTSLLLQDRRLTLLIEEARRRIPEPFSKEQLESFVEKASDYYDPLYFEFEDQFRGTRDDIKERQRIYLPYIREVGAGTEERPVLDLGCGRGEWLELLNEEGFIARGVDMNTSMISLCHDLGLEVTRSDVLQYLRDLPEGSIGAVTGFHIVEHLPFEVLLKLFDEFVRVLKPGGIAIFETPNPENIQVGSCNFYFDPTHINPLPSSMLKFMAEARGLCRVSVLNLHPYPESYWLSGSELAERFSQLFYGPQDYAVVGWKA